jgi:hypothetical protein
VKLNPKVLTLSLIFVSTSAFAQFGDILNRMKKEVETAIQKGNESVNPNSSNEKSNEPVNRY